MNEQNQKNVSTGVKVLILFLYALLTIATCAAVWSFCPEVFVKLLAGALFACNGFAIYKLAKKVHNE